MEGWVKTWQNVSSHFYHRYDVNGFVIETSKVKIQNGDAWVFFPALANILLETLKVKICDPIGKHHVYDLWFILWNFDSTGSLP